MILANSQVKKTLNKHELQDIPRLQELAKVYEDKQELDEAVKCYQNILNLQPKNVAARLKLAKAFKQNNQIIEAIAAYKKAIEIKPNLPFRAYLDLAEVLNEAEQLEEAILAYQKAFELKADLPVWVYRKLGDALEKKGRLDEAIALYQNVLEKQPNNSELYRILGRFESKQGAFNKAVACYKKAIELNKEQPLWVYTKLIDGLKSEQKFAEAVAIHRQFQELRMKAGKVIEGKNEWLFLDKDSNQIMKQVTGELTFSEAELIYWKTLLEMRSLWLNRYQINYCFFVVPNKACVYPEFLPDNLTVSPKRTIMQLKTYLEQNSFVKVIYPLAELQQAKSKMKVYSKDDTHWNDFGAFIGYQKLAEKISKVIDIHKIDASDVSFREKILGENNTNDLGSKIGQTNSTFIQGKLKKPNSKCIYNNNVVNRGNFRIYENTNTALPKAVIFRDSFSTLLLKFLSESFSRLVAVWQPNLDYSIIEKEKPDIVISQQVERFLMKIPDDLNGKTNEEYVKLKNQLEN